MLLQGVHLNGWPGGIVSAVHDDQDKAKTVEAFKQTLRMLEDEGEIKTA
jgi:hypothetical protein